VIASERKGILVPGQNKLELHHRAKAETNLTQREAIFPFPHATASGEASVGESLRAMGMEDLNIGDDDAVALGDGEDLGQSRKISSREHVLAMNGSIATGVSAWLVGRNRNFLTKTL
jgi:hypothetical protein